MNNKSLFAFLLLFFASFEGFFSPTASAHMRGMYATKAEAEKHAAQLKCKGAFQMGELWMPCASERALHDALQHQ